MHRFFLSVLSILILSCTPDIIPEKFEMRGVWVATVNNIDWPLQPLPNSRILKEEFRSIAATHQENNFNALVVQVRPSADAFYSSEWEPWSKYLTGEQGLPPEPYFDPLHYMIEETHNRGMEFHAWINPYRAVIGTESSETSLNHISRLRPGWFLKYGPNLYFNPGIPEAREYLVKVIGEIVRNYDLDAIHFDDYFYPYKIAGEEFPDSTSFTRYGRDFRDVADWRRDNVNQLVRELSIEIKSIKPFVKFGISPFGVWRNIENDPEGSESRAGQTNYDHLYADVRHWLKNEWIDYVIPQIYWHIGFAPADYSTLIDWWSSNSFGRHLYIGQGAYRIGSDRSEEWLNPNEMPNHLRLNKQYPEILGNVFFSSKSFESNPLGFTDSLRINHYAYPALMPPMKWIDDIKPETISLGQSKVLPSGCLLEWEYPKGESEGYAIIYRAKGKEMPDINDTRNIVAKIRYPESQYVDEMDRKGYYSYVITYIDRNNNESLPSNLVTLKFR